MATTTATDDRLVTVGMLRDALTAVLMETLSPIFVRLDAIEGCLDKVEGHLEAIDGRLDELHKGQEALATAHGSFATKVLMILQEDHYRGGEGMTRPKKRKRQKKPLHLTPEEVRKGEKVAKALMRPVRPFVKRAG